MHHLLILKGKTSVLNIYVYILPHVNKWGYEQLMSIQESFHLIHPATAPAALPILAWAAAESPTAPADCKAEKTPVVAPPYTADWTAAAILPPATPKK